MSSATSSRSYVEKWLENIINEQNVVETLENMVAHRRAETLLD